MSEEFRKRPFGDVLVEVRQPYIRFGMAVVFGIRTAEQNIHMGRIQENGRLTYEQREIGTDHQPTLELDEYEWEALSKAMNSLPARFHGASHLEHLADTMRQRDEVIEM